MTAIRLPVLVLALTAAVGCQLRRPDVIPARMIEPRLIDVAPATPSTPGAPAADAVAVRVLATQARGHIGRRLLHLRTGGELVEDPSWRWSSSPARYLDSALRQALDGMPGLRAVDAGNVPTLAVTLLAWHLDDAGTTRMTGAVEVEVMSVDRAMRTITVRLEEPVAPDLPGDLAEASGRLLQRLASESLTRASAAIR